MTFSTGCAERRLRAPLQVLSRAASSPSGGLAHRLESLNAFVCCADEHCHAARQHRLRRSAKVRTGRRVRRASRPVEQKLTPAGARAQASRPRAMTIELRGLCKRLRRLRESAWPSAAPAARMRVVSAESGIGFASSGRGTRGNLSFSSRAASSLRAVNGHRHRHPASRARSIVASIELQPCGIASIPSTIERGQQDGDRRNPAADIGVVRSLRLKLENATVAPMPRSSFTCGAILSTSGKSVVST